MSVPVKRTLNVLSAKYVSDAKSVLIVGECEEGRFRTQIYRDALIPGGIQEGLPEKDVGKLFTSFAKDIVGKELTIVFDPDVTERMKANDLNY